MNIWNEAWRTLITVVMLIIDYVWTGNLRVFRCKCNENVIECDQTVLKGKGVGLESRHIGKPNQRTLLYPLAMISAYMLPATIDPTLNLCTRYPLLLGGQRQCGFKACPRLLHMTGAAGIEPQTSRSRVQRLNRSATRSTQLTKVC